MYVYKYLTNLFIYLIGWYYEPYSMKSSQACLKQQANPLKPLGKKKLQIARQASFLEDKCLV